MEFLLFSVTGLIVLVLLWELFFVFPTKWLKVERVHWNSKVKKKIIQISDLHIKHLRVPLRTIQSLIEAENPDYIFLTGDFIDQNEKEFPLLSEFLKMIEETNIESYAVLGNHDRRIKDLPQLENLLEAHGVYLLKNDYVEKEDIIIVGIDDYAKGFHDIETSFRFSNPKGKEVLVLTHDPNIVEEIEHSFTMLIAGHLHGKQVNVPYFFHFVNMGELPKKGIYKGRHSREQGSFYISKGIGQSHLNFRFMVRSEVTIHELGC
ncbi:metallophosphoesterase [Bacillus sp. FJAT-47783]|uniref:metallophosphoesterase n=1 Tax=Bacillus sp. FJAT-47783 TaxID=2922712 RepID=UPI001FADF50C|nr:metallophosphoesterase [Bacillus sp. FJAT-47783]